VFLSHYCTWSISLAIVAMPCLVEQTLFPESKAVRILFIVAVTVWATLMLETWKRSQSRIVMFWGTTNAAEAAPNRATFNETNPEIEMVPSYITGAPMLYFSPMRKAHFTRQSKAVIGTLLVIVFAMTFGVFMIKTLSEHNVKTTADVRTAEPSKSAKKLEDIIAVLVPALHAVLIVTMVSHSGGMRARSQHSRSPPSHAPTYQHKQYSERTTSHKFLSGRNLPIRCNRAH